jgi:[acyl-carrier-protein] S-malonyltransferase
MMHRTLAALKKNIRFSALRRQNVHLDYFQSFSTASKLDIYDPEIASYPVMFPGQGCQHPGMLLDACVTHPESRALLDEASAILGRDIIALCSDESDANRALLDSTAWSQPAIFVSCMARAALYKADPTHPLSTRPPTVALGLSLGEYSALCFAGARGFADGVRLTAARGRAMQRACDPPNPRGCLVSVSGLPVEAVLGACTRARLDTPTAVVAVATYLAPQDCVVGGEEAAVDAALALLAAEHGAGGFRTARLPVAGAFHTELMAPAGEELAAAIAATALRAPAMPVLTTYGRTVCYSVGAGRDEKVVVAAMRQNLLRQLTEPVRWRQTVASLVYGVPDAAGVQPATVNPHLKSSVELGPGASCAAILKRFNRRLKVVSF